MFGIYVAGLLPFNTSMTAVYYAKTIFYAADVIKILTITRGTQLF